MNVWAATAAVAAAAGLVAGVRAAVRGQGHVVRDAAGTAASVGVVAAGVLGPCERPGGLARHAHSPLRRRH
jgi:hypothetical protein